MKHAYLILAHNEFEVLGRLLRAIDDERNDIYIHFDRKIASYPDCRTSHAKLTILTERVDVRWGDISVVKAEYALFEEAYRQGRYRYYHLLSGVDMPLKSQDDIHRFFEENDGKEFIGYYQGDRTAEIERKVRRWHLFPGSFKEINGVVAVAKKVLRAGFIRLQQMVGYDRNVTIEFRKGTQWVSLTVDCVGYLLQHQDEVEHIYSHTFCADEIFVQTLCWNSSFRDHVYDSGDEERGCLRMIGWKDNQIKEWAEKDFEALMESGALFARKFTSRHIGVVEQILNAIER